MLSKIAHGHDENTVPPPQEGRYHAQGPRHNMHHLQIDKLTPNLLPFKAQEAPSTNSHPMSSLLRPIRNHSHRGHL